MKNCFLRPSGTAVALLAAAIFATAATAQTPQAQTATTPEAGSDEHIRTYPAPTNLQVLPKDLTGKTVHEIMEEWTDELGTHCSVCHAPDPKAPPRANGEPSLDFASDKKAQKKTARLMYTLEQDIRDNYMSKIDNVGTPVTCGTCHQGHLSPPPFSPPPKRPPATPPQ